MKKLALIFVFIIFSQAEANPIRIGVSDFVDRTSGAVLQKDMTENFIAVIDSYSSNIDIVKSRSFQALNAETAASAGKSANCKYIILGAVTNEKTESKNVEKPGLFYSTPTAVTQIHTINIALRLIETETGKIIFSASGIGSASFTRKIQEQIKLYQTQEGKLKALAEFNKNRMQAFKAASSMAAEKICIFLTGEYPEVISVKIAPSKKGRKKNDSQSTVTINKGTSSGVYEKTFYRIFYESSELFGSEKINLAVAEVTISQNNSCTANILAGNAGNIRAGYKAEQISPEEAQLIIDNNDFVQRRQVL